MTSVNEHQCYNNPNTTDILSPMAHFQTPTSLLAIVLMATMAASWSPDAEKDKVPQLDGYLIQGYELFSGYLMLSQPAEPLINVHYVFMTAIGNYTDKDLVMWLNGGPGCSSMLGLTQQIGPNLLLPGSPQFSSYINPYSWNKLANLLFFESPPGVGFSINNDPRYIYNESRTANDNVAALKLWFERFPEMKGNNFWITGQSYCGMYIPYYASALIDANKNQQIKFKGIMIGNGVMVTDKYWRRLARNKFYSKHYFYGPDIEQMIKNCDYNASDTTNPSCIKGNLLGDASVINVNPYATIGICYGQDLSQPKLGRRRFYYTPFFEQNNPIMTELNAGNYIPCVDDSGMEKYFNSSVIKNQLHVDLNVNWQSCNQVIGEKYMKDNSSISIFQKLKNNKLQILLYSGNTDAVVSYVETVAYIQQIGWREISGKHQLPFKNSRGSLMGWWTEYDGLTLAIINGAGHMVPTDKPHAAYQMVSNFLARSR